ncbi:hypothetical protein BGZ60DRAFT_562917 [Tricladium varicosporioides]|nr:hypothetical protein BGZ60DRAFT_562917 [Hymenoscyphus varicosporioides]
MPTQETSNLIHPANLSDFLPSTSSESAMPTQETLSSSQKPESCTQEQSRPRVYREIRMRMRIFCCHCQAITGWWEGQCLKCSHEGCSDCLFTQTESIERDADSATTQVLADARPYFGVQRGSKHTIIDPLLPLATKHDLQEWISFLQGKRWRKEDIEKAGYSKAACSYVKLYRDGQSDI